MRTQKLVLASFFNFAVSPMAETLFTGTPISVLTDMTQRNLEQEIVSLSNDAVLGTKLDDLVAYFVDKHSISVPVLHTDNLEFTPQEGLIGHDGQPTTAYTLHIPYSGDQGMFRYMPPVTPAKYVTGSITAAEILLYAGGSMSPDAVNKKFDEEVAIVEENLRRIRADVDRFNSALPQIIRPRLDSRLRQAQQSRQTTSGIKFRMRKVENAPQTYKLPDKPRKVAPVVVKKTSTETEVVMEEGDYQEILRICQSMSLVMERSPSVFEHAEEEHIRVHYLVQLNGQYAGEATGETFNHIGKTDILIRHQDKNIFVAECKFWGGQKVLSDTADQLLGYTTWRDTKTALIIFSRRQSFTNVINEAQIAMKAHKNYKSGPIKEDESRFRYIFTHPNDSEREIIVTLLLFNMPKPVSASSS